MYNYFVKSGAAEDKVESFITKVSLRKWYYRSYISMCPCSRRLHYNYVK